MTPNKTEAQPEALRLELHQECADFATSLRSAANVVQLQGRKSPPSFLKAADLFEQAAAEIQQLKAQQNELREEQRLCMLEASGLANSMFKKHFSHERHYASGEVVWGLCDSVRGVISQIDNMASGLVRPETQLSARQAALHGWRIALERIADPRNKHFAGDAQIVALDALSAAPPPPEREPLLPDFPAAKLHSPACWCETCDTTANSGLRSRMSLCPDCGNKRCPKATHHDNACTNSNSPGQPGSSWEHVKPHGATNDNP